jgi:hypothetical protein
LKSKEKNHPSRILPFQMSEVKDLILFVFAVGCGFVVLFPVTRHSGKLLLSVQQTISFIGIYLR